MKAIIKVNKSSSFAKHNYLTFDVKEVVSSNLIALNINGVTTDFSVKEVIIVDIVNEYRSVNNWGTSESKKISNFLNNYIYINQINY